MTGQEYSEEALKRASREFRQAASRLRRTDHSDGLGNAKRFIRLVEEDSVLSEIVQNAVEEHPKDIEEIVESRGWGESYPDFLDEDEEMAFAYQLLEYGAENFRNFRQFSEGLSRSKRASDHNAKFLKDVVLPLINTVEKEIAERMPEEDEAQQQAEINVEGEQNLVNIGQGGSQAEARQVNITYGDVITQVEETLTLIEETGQSSETMEECEEVLREIHKELESSDPDEGRLSDLFSTLRQRARDGLLTLEVALAFDQLQNLATNLGVA